MRIISFGWTSPALLAGAKTVTRRDWKDSWARRFKKGDICQAYDKDPRYGGKRIAYIELTEYPVKEPMANMLESDYYKEGFSYLHEHPELIPASMPFDVSPAGFNQWRLDGTEMWVIRFRLRKEVCLDCNEIDCLCAEADEIARTRTKRKKVKV